MNCKIKLFFYAVLVFEAIASIQSDQDYEDDVTKQLDTWISRMFKVNSDMFKKLLSRITQEEVDSYTHTMKQDIYPFGQQLRFSKVYMNITEFKSPQINWKFSSNKMSLFLKEFTIRLIGTLRDESDDNFVKFDTHLDMENVTFTLAINEDKVSHEFKSENNWIWFNDDYNVIWNEIGSNELVGSKRDLLAKEFETILPFVLRENLKTNEHFTKSLKAIFHVYIDPKNKLVETHKDFFTSEQKYYYLIPKIPFYSFNMKNVFIRGLCNMEWLKINTGISIFTHTLMIRNVQGNFVLDYGTNQEKPLNLQFKIDYLSLSMDRKAVNVDARCYSVNKTNVPLPYRQSALIMQRIETAVANSIFPNLEVRGTYEIDTPLEQLKITDSTDWNTIKQSFKEWIPFNDDSKPPAGAAQTKT